MQPNPWLTAELAALRTDEALRAAARRQLVRESRPRPVPRRVLSRKVGAALVAVGRRLAGPELSPPCVGRPPLQQAPSA